MNEVVPLADLMTTARRWADEILECSPLAVRASKQQVRMGIEMPLEAAINSLYYEHQKMMVSHDVVEGPTAFAQKRKPQWKGR